MEWIYRLLFLSLLAACSLVHSQGTSDILDLVSEKSTVQYKIGDSPHTASRFVITVPSYDDFYLWIDDDEVAGESTYGRIRIYFNQQNGDYTLQLLLSEDLLRDHLPILGKTYLKQLKSGSKFELILICNKEEACSQLSVEAWLRNHVVVQNKGDVEKLVKIIPEKLHQDRASFIVVNMMDFK